MGEGLKIDDFVVEGFYCRKTVACMNFLRILSMFNFSFPMSWIVGRWKEYRANVIILFSELCSKESIDIIDEINPNSRKILYLWNTGVNKNSVLYAKNKGWEIWSFDRRECEKERYSLISQFYPRPVLDEIEIKRDVFFVVMTKDELMY